MFSESTLLSFIPYITNHTSKNCAVFHKTKLPKYLFHLLNRCYWNSVRPIDTTLEKMHNYLNVFIVLLISPINYQMLLNIISVRQTISVVVFLFYNIISYDQYYVAFCERVCTLYYFIRSLCTISQNCSKQGLYFFINDIWLFRLSTYILGIQHNMIAKMCFKADSNYKLFCTAINVFRTFDPFVFR